MKIEVRTSGGGFWGRYSNFSRAQRTAQYLKKKGLAPQLISKYFKERR